eukprot:13731678-Heterocapsa_arctica.AAC.1
MQACKEKGTNGGHSPRWGLIPQRARASSRRARCPRERRADPAAAALACPWPLGPAAEVAAEVNSWRPKKPQKSSWRRSHAAGVATASCCRRPARRTRT